MALSHDVPRPAYADRIVVDPAILVGKPTIKGTRLSVELVLEHLAATPDFDDLFEAFPHITMDDMRACFLYASALPGLQPGDLSPDLDFR